MANKLWKLLAHHDPKNFPVKGGPDGNKKSNEEREFNDLVSLLDGRNESCQSSDRIQARLGNQGVHSYLSTRVMDSDTTTFRFASPVKKC